MPGTPTVKQVRCCCTVKYMCVDVNICVCIVSLLGRARACRVNNVPRSNLQPKATHARAKV